jgi:glucosamine-6-phosphate deaminase
MNIDIANSQKELGKRAGEAASRLITDTIKKKGSANILLATGTSQFQTLHWLINEEHIDWSKVTMFHLDEYIGLPVSHPASFRKYLIERFLEKLPSLKSAYLINGEENADEECKRLGAIITNHPIDVALAGIGENGHLAFNDPPADFETEEPYIIVNLDEPCRKQQLGEGWFHTFEEVPVQAISMSIRQIMKSSHIVCSVPDTRKAKAVKNSVEPAISNLYPASILQQHPDCTLYLDSESASLLTQSQII